MILLSHTEDILFEEVSCFGRDGEGDSGDHWIVLCNTEEWLRGEPIRLKHEDTGAFQSSLTLFAFCLASLQRCLQEPYCITGNKIDSGSGNSLNMLFFSHFDSNKRSLHLEE